MNDTHMLKLRSVIEHRDLCLQGMIAFQKAQITGNYHNQVTRAYASGRVEGHEMETRFLDTVLDLIKSGYFEKI